MGGSDYGILRQEHALQHLWVIHQAYGHLTGIQPILVCLPSHYLNVLFKQCLRCLGLIFHGWQFHDMGSTAQATQGSKG